MNIRNIISCSVSLAAWSAVTAGAVTGLLQGRSVVPLIADGTGVFKAAFVTGSAMGLGMFVFFGAWALVAHYKGKNSQDDETQNEFFKNWVWVVLIPQLGIPYIAGLSVATSITLLAVGWITFAAKERIVEALPNIDEN